MTKVASCLGGGGRKDTRRQSVSWNANKGGSRSEVLQEREMGWTGRLIDGDGNEWFNPSCLPASYRQTSNFPLPTSQQLLGEGTRRQTARVMPLPTGPWANQKPPTPTGASLPSVGRIQSLRYVPNMPSVRGAAFLPLSPINHSFFFRQIHWPRPSSSSFVHHIHHHSIGLVSPSA